MTQKISLITGASRGLGYATAEALAGPDTHIIAVARTVGGLEELADRVEARGGSITLVPLDITDHDGLARMARAIFDRWGHLDLWVHCAVHAAPLSPAPHVDAKDWDHSFAVNATATARLIAALEPLLKLRDGVTVMVTDPRAGQRFFGAYGASKAAQQSLVDSWISETANIGPRVLRFTPDPMATAVRARFFPGEATDDLSPPQAEALRLLTLLNA